MPRESKQARNYRAQRILKTLFETHPDAHCALHYSNPYELLCATILSAQCTDKVVNTVTPTLFKRYPDPAHLAKARPAEIVVPCSPRMKPPRSSGDMASKSSLA